MLFLHSKSIMSYLSKAKMMAREILLSEVGVKVNHQRFYWKGYLYPLKFIAFEKAGVLGHFDSNKYTIGLNKCLILQASDKILKDIIRHELAHYITYLEYGPNTKHHGAEFHTICKKYNWNDDIKKATMDFNMSQYSSPSTEIEKIKSKVDKLLKLSKSTNPNEAQMAMVKANNLIVEHNLNYIREKKNFQDHDLEDELMAYVKSILNFKKNTGKIQAIYEILETFYVRPILNYGRENHYLEVVGDRTHVELAEYVAQFLDTKLEQIWKSNQKLYPYLKGTSKKTSFMLGLAKGYKEKINEQHKNAHCDIKNSVLVLKNNLSKQFQLAFGRTGHTKVTGQSCPVSNQIGRQNGLNLSITPALNRPKTSTKLLN